MLKQMSEKGASTKKGWSSSRSSSGEGPDEVGSVDGLQTENEPFSPGYSMPSQQQQTTTTGNTTTPSTFGNNDQYLEQQESFSSGASTDRANVSTQEQQHQSNELESSESRKLVAEADDLKSKLRELNIGSFSLDGQDG